jgi:hypothetical protein
MTKDELKIFMVKPRREIIRESINNIISNIDIINNEYRVETMRQSGRNNNCMCGSGIKAKKCDCYQKNKYVFTVYNNRNGGEIVRVHVIPIYKDVEEEIKNIESHPDFIELVNGDLMNDK